jgi:hypothetical protein
MVKIGAYSPNRVLELEDENTIGPDGDIHVMQNQNVTLEQIANGALPSTAGSSSTTQTDPNSPAEEDPALLNAVDRISALLEAEHV